MADRFQHLLTQFAALSPLRQAIFAATAIGSLAFFFWISASARTEEFRVLYRGLGRLQATSRNPSSSPGLVGFPSSWNAE